MHSAINLFLYSPIKVQVQGHVGIIGRFSLSQHNTHKYIWHVSHEKFNFPVRLSAVSIVFQTRSK